MNFRLKKFLSYYRPYLGMFVTILVCALISAGTTLVFPLLTRYITKTVLAGGLTEAIDQIYTTGVLMLLLVVIHTACSFYYDYRGHAMGAMMESDMRAELFAHYQRLSFRFYDEQKIGQLMSRLTNDLLSLTELYHHGPEDIVIYTIRFFGAFFILININLKLTLAVFAFLPVMGAFAFYFGKRVKAALKRNKERIGDINSQIEDNLAGIRVVQSFANEEIEQRKFAYENGRFLNSRKDTYKNEAYLFQGIEAFTQLITVTVVVLGGVSIVNASLDLPDLITFLLYIGSLIEPIIKFTHIAEQYQEGITGFERVMEILDIDPDIKDSQQATDLADVKGRIEFRNVGFRYNDQHDYVLKDISLVIEPGDYVALVGSSGVGKTTLCSLIPRFYDVSEGQVLVDGVDVRNVCLRSLRRNVGIVQQDVYLFAGTVIENIRYGKPNATEEEIVEAAKKANAHEFITKLPNGYYTDIGQRGVKLSGGQKQRLSIARVFLKNPPIVIFDEATSALDNESERAVQESFESLARNRTTIVIAHRLSTIKNAQRIIVLAGSGIDEEGRHEQLMALGGTYSRLYQT